MKRHLIALLASLLPLAAHARNPQPLHIPTRPPEPVPPIVGRVVLVHGFLETGVTFKQLHKRLAKRGLECVVPRLRPADARGGLERLARQLQHDIDAAYGPDARISIVAFSMGGLVSRYYLQNLGGAARCDQLLTISSPHQGTKAAWCYPTQGACQMRPGSDFLRQLDQSVAALGDMPVVSYRTPMDLVIVPPVNSVWSRAQNVEYPVLMHPLMLNSPAVLSDIERRLTHPIKGTLND